MYDLLEMLQIIPDFATEIYSFPKEAICLLTLYQTTRNTFGKSPIVWFIQLFLYSILVAQKIVLRNTFDLYRCSQEFGKKN